MLKDEQAQLVSFLLKQNHYEIVSCNEHRLPEILQNLEALGIILDEHVDIKTLRFLKSNLETRKIPILKIVSRKYSTSREYHDPADFYLQAPFTVEEFYSCLEEMLKIGTPILHPATIGILGSGQLGRMLALAARPYAYNIHVFSPEANSPTGQVADREFVAAYDDLDAVREFAQSVDVVTYEFENVPLATAEACAAIVPLRPGAQALRVAQNRLVEKRFFADNGLPTAPFTAVHSLADLQAGLAQIGCPAVLKTAVSGYDGKGQVKLNHPNEAAEAWQSVGEVDCILEGWVEFEREVSMVVARDVNGRIAHYNLIENSHHNHILDVSVAPADVPPQVLAQAEAMVQTVLTALDVVGVLCVEFFLTPTPGPSPWNGEASRLLLNEIAPRPHNSGHLTIEACATSQFEQQLRTVCGLPVGDTTYLRPAAMANLLGDLWDFSYEETKEQKAQREVSVNNLRQSAKSVAKFPDWTAVLTNPHLKLHLYGKKSARPGRKMGHLTALAESVAEAEKIVRGARERLVIE